MRNNFIKHLYNAHEMGFGITIIRVSGIRTKSAIGRIESIDRTEGDYIVIKVNGRSFVVTDDDIITSDFSHPSKKVYGIYSEEDDCTITVIF